jgi:DNA-directed RNA polymerase subunit F
MAEVVESASVAWMKEVLKRMYAEPDPEFFRVSERSYRAMRAFMKFQNADPRRLKREMRKAFGR